MAEITGQDFHPSLISDTWLNSKVFVTSLIRLITLMSTCILTVCFANPSIYMDVACEVLTDRWGSDHHPIIITANTSDYSVPERVPKWNSKKAKWDAFRDQCITEITPDLFNDADDKMAIFPSTLIDIAAERNKANRFANKHPSAVNSMRACLIQAKTKKLFKQKKRDFWKNYVSSVNVNTPSKKVWDMIRKITGKNVASPMHHFKDENETNCNHWQSANSKYAWWSYWKKIFFRKLLQRVPIYQGTKRKAKDQL